MRTRKQAVPVRMRLPPRRSAETFAPRIVGPEGAHRVHVTVGRVRGEVVEVWVDVHKEGAPLRGFAHALARLASHALQAGTPLTDVVRSLVGTEGGPSGSVEDCDGVAEAKSIPDLVGQVLAQAGREHLEGRFAAALRRGEAGARDLAESTEGVFGE